VVLLATEACFIWSVEMKNCLLVLLSLSCSYGTTLSGSLKNPDGSGATGTLYFSLSQQAALSTSGTCGGPAQIVPTVQIPVIVTSGVLQGSPTLAGNDCLLPQGTYYNIQFKDGNGNLIFSDRWSVVGTTQDIGTIVSVVISGTTQTLGQSGVVLTIPAANTPQTITQQSEQYPLNINYLNVTQELTGPAGMVCSSAGCSWASPTAFPGGLATGAPGTLALPGSVPTNIFISPTGTFYNRTQQADVSCSGLTNGFQALRTDTTPPSLQFCVAGVMWLLPLQAP
jgi:hypothetical protein